MFSSFLRCDDELSWYKNEKRKILSLTLRNYSRLSSLSLSFLYFTQVYSNRDVIFMEHGWMNGSIDDVGVYLSSIECFMAHKAMSHYHPQIFFLLSVKLFFSIFLLVIPFALALSLSRFLLRMWLCYEMRHHNNQHPYIHNNNILPLMSFYWLWLMCNLYF